jgi:Arc/MetJ-type ribon-helix-helix transcriptional regulator
MNKQINLRLPNELLETAEKYAKKHGFANIQEFIKEAIRLRLFEEEVIKEELQTAKKLAEVAEERIYYSG